MERKEVIGFVGLGIMGSAMVQRLLTAGFPVYVNARNQIRAAPILRSGANWVETIPALARRCRCIFTIVGGPADVESIYLGSEGLIAHSAPGTCLVDMTTSSPELARRISAAAAARDIQTFDAPVTGGAPGAKAGTLTFMVGGDPAALSTVRPILEAMGSRIFPIGPAGAGQTAKASNQIAVAGILLGLAEALHFAETSGIPASLMLAVLKTGTAAGPLLERLGPKMVADDGTSTFYIDHFIKDLSIAIDAPDGDARLPAAELCRQLCRDIAQRRAGRQGIQSIIQYYRQPSGSDPA